MGEKSKRNWLKKVKGFVTFFVVGVVLSGSTIQALAATESQKEEVKQMIVDSYYNADTSSKNILQYRLTSGEFDEIYQELTKGGHARIIGSYGVDTKINYSQFWSYVFSFNLSTEDTGALERFERVNENADAILAGIEEEMDSLDTIIYLHDSVVELVTYNASIGDQAYTLGGALGDKNAVCRGYAYALNLLLQEAGFETDYTRSPSLSHGWSYVELDGEWYHIDPTWDDTRSAVKGQTSHQFLLRNDAEFMAAGTNSHGSDLYPIEGSPASTSAKYTDWFVHDIIGKMAFEDGLWYFVDPDTKDIACADADGSFYETVVEYSGQTLTVVDMEDTILTYTADGTRMELDITMEVPEEEKISDESADVTEEDNETVGEDAVGKTTGIDYKLEDINLSDYTLWCAGKYNATGEIEEYLGCSSTIDRYGVTVGGEYTLTMKDNRFRLVILEYNTENQLIAESILASGEVYFAGAETVSVGLSMYMPIWKDLAFEEVAKKLKYDLHSVEFVLQNNGIVETPENTTASDTGGDEVIVAECDLTPIAEMNLSDYNLWCEGKYNSQAAVEEYLGYCSTSECYAVQAGAEYVLTMRDTRFRVVVFEFDASNQLIAETTLSSGDVHIMNANTCHVGLSMYMPIWKDMAFSEVITKLKYDLHSVELVLQNNGIMETPEDITDSDTGSDEVIAAECDLTSIAEMNLSDYNLWCEGKYNSQAAVEEYLGYCSTSECYTVQAGAEYVLTMKDTRFCVVVFEFDASNQLIA